jgi:uncharacterized membrane protein YfcA
MLLLLGSIVGVMAGLLGIGGGLIVVPALLYLLPLAGLDGSLAMQMALATSLASIILTSGSSALNHLKLGNVDLSIVRWLIPGVVFGGFIGSYIAELIPSDYLPKVFGAIVMLLAIQMLLSVRMQRTRQQPGKSATLGAGCIIGTVSTLAGIGGGSLIVPYLSRYGVEMRRAIGTSSVCGSVIALSGMTGFILHGVGNAQLPQYSVGYVYLPALLAIAATSVLTTRVGASLASRMPTASLKKLFALFLLCVSIKMLLS